MKSILFSILFFLFISLQLFARHKKVNGTTEYIAALKKVTDVMLSDVTSPVAASRYYAYISLTAYQMQSLFNNKNYPSLYGYVNKLPAIKIDGILLKSADPSLAIILAIFKSAEKLLPSGYLLKKQTDSLKHLYLKSMELTKIFTQTLL